MLILSLRKLWGFLLYGFPEENCLCLLSLVFIVVHVIISFKYPKIIMLASFIKSNTRKFDVEKYDAKGWTQSIILESLA